MIKGYFEFWNNVISFSERDGRVTGGEASNEAVF